VPWSLAVVRMKQARIALPAHWEIEPEAAKADFPDFELPTRRTPHWAEAFHCPRQPREPVMPR